MTMTGKSKLETPRESRRSLRPKYDPEVIGRVSEGFARFIGTARFLVYMSLCRNLDCLELCCARKPAL